MHDPRKTQQGSSTQKSGPIVKVHQPLIEPTANGFVRESLYAETEDGRMVRIEMLRERAMPPPGAARPYIRELRAS